MSTRLTRSAAAKAQRAMVGAPPLPQPLTFDADDEARQQIDAQIAVYEKAVRQLKSRRNQLSSISRLPPEVLCRIFIAYAEQKISDVDLLFPAASYCYPKTKPDWINVTHVSKHWRDVALQCPQLWSTISFSSPSWASAMLERSKQVALSIHVSSGMSPKSEEVALRALSQPSRLKHVKVTGHPTFTKKMLKKLSGAAAPRLHTLDLFCTSYAPGVTNAFPDDYLSGGAPALRNLSISGWATSWDSPLFQGLQSLKLTLSADALKANEIIPKPSTSADFVNALNNMPLLEELHLNTVLPVFGDVQGPPCPLRHLKVLKLRGTADECTGVLLRISIPTTATVDLYCTIQDDDDSMIPSVLAALNSAWFSNPLSSPTPVLPFKSLQVEGDGTRPLSMTIRARTCDIDFASYYASILPTNLTPALAITFRKPYAAGASAVPLQPIITGLPLNPLLSLKLYVVEPSTETLDIFSKLPALKSIAVAEGAARSLVDHLLQDPALQTDASKKRTRGGRKKSAAPLTRFPTLKSLAFTSVHFGDFIGITPPVDLTEFVDVLTKRLERGNRLERLKLVDCWDLFDREVVELEDVVDSVDWDGEEQEDALELCRFGCDCGMGCNDYDDYDDDDDDDISDYGYFF